MSGGGEGDEEEEELELEEEEEEDDLCGGEATFAGGLSGCRPLSRSLCLSVEGERLARRLSWGDGERRNLEGRNSNVSTFQGVDKKLSCSFLNCVTDKQADFLHVSQNDISDSSYAGRKEPQNVKYFYYLHQCSAQIKLSEC